MTQALRAAGLGPGAWVAYVGENAPEYFEVLFGAARLGVVVAPVNWRRTPQQAGSHRDGV